MARKKLPDLQQAPHRELQQLIWPRSSALSGTAARTAATPASKPFCSHGPAQECGRRLCTSHPTKRATDTGYLLPLIHDRKPPCTWLREMPSPGGPAHLMGEKWQLTGCDGCLNTNIAAIQRHLPPLHLHDTAQGAALLPQNLPCSWGPNCGHGETHPTPPDQHRTHYVASYATQHSFLLKARLPFTGPSEFMYGNCSPHELTQIIYKSTKLLPCSWEGQGKAELEKKAWNNFRKIMFASVSDDLALLSLDEVLATRMESFHCSGEPHTLSAFTGMEKHQKQERCQAIKKISSALPSKWHL